MKYIKLNGLDNEIPIFDNEELCETCSYPKDKKGGNSCNIFFKNRIVTGGEIYFDKIFSVGKYIHMKESLPLEKSPRDTMTWLILNYKGRKEMAPFCAELLNLKFLEVFPNLGASKEKTIICFVPDDEEEPLQKGELLASEFSKRVGIDFYSLFKKIKKTKKQHKLHNLKEKRENVKGAYIIREEFVPFLDKKTILLVDDVVTSMLTINECSKLLKEKGAEKIFVFSVSRALLSKEKGKRTK